MRLCRDLKSSNILLTKEGVAKIGDVGLAKTMVSDYFSWETAVGTCECLSCPALCGCHMVFVIPDSATVEVALQQSVSQRVVLKHLTQSCHAMTSHEHCTA